MTGNDTWTAAWATLEPWRDVLLSALQDEYTTPRPDRPTGASDADLTDVIYLLRDATWPSRVSPVTSADALLPRWNHEAALTQCAVALLAIRCEPWRAELAVPLLRQLPASCRPAGDER